MARIRFVLILIALAVVAASIGACAEDDPAVPAQNMPETLAVPTLSAELAASTSSGDSETDRPDSNTPVAPSDSPATDSLTSDAPAIDAPSPGPPATPVALDYDIDRYGDLNAIDLSGTQVDFLHMHYDWRGEALQDIVDRFNAENPYGIHVTNVVPGSYPEVQEAMRQAAESDAYPALVSAYQHWATDYVTQGVLVALDPYLEHANYGFSEEELADFFPAFLAADRLPQFENLAYGFPYRRSQGVLFYNADWLAELYESGAISFEGPPQTPEEFAEAACAATATPQGVGYEIAPDASRIASWTFAFGGDVYDDENGRYTWDSPETIAALQMMQDLYRRGCVKKISEHQGELFDFSGRRALFVYGSSAYMPYYQEAVAQDPAGDFAWSVAPIPYWGEQPVQNSFGPSLSIPRTDPATQLAAWLFIKYLAQPETQAQWVAGSDYYPVRRSAYDYLDDYVAEHPAYADGFALLPFSTFEPPLTGYGTVHDLAADTYFRILAGEDVTSALQQLNAAANATLEQAP